MAVAGQGELANDRSELVECRKSDFVFRTMIAGVGLRTCDKYRLLDLVENFALFSEHKAGLAKIIGQNHQVLGVNAAIASLHRIRPALANPATLTPAPLPAGEGQSLRDPHPNPLPEREGQYRGELQYSGLVDRARELRQRQTPAEDIAWELLRDRRFEGLKFRRQHQIGNYIADFCCAEHKLDVVKESVLTIDTF